MNGNIFDGEWVEDQRQGWGVYIWSNGDKYEGMWNANQPSGVGRMIYADDQIKTSLREL